MTRNLGRIVAGLATVLILSAVAAGAAQAATVTATAYPSTFTVQETGTNVFSNGVREISCSEVTLHGQIAGPTNEIEVEPTYSGCTGNASTTATVTTNGCKVLLTFKPNEESKTGSVGEDVKCPAGKSIEIHIWGSGKKHTEASLCTLSIGPQTIVSAGEYHDEFILFNWLIVYTRTTHSMHVARTSGTAANCGKETTTTGTYTGTWDLRSFKEGANTSLMVG